jgi:ornithine carbamoyltransferase
VLLFEKTSTRTRCSFEVGGHDLGMNVTYLDPGSSQMGKKESIEDTARVLGRMFDGIEYRGFAQERVETLAKYAGVPVWNGLTTEFHPTQMIADILTMREEFGRDLHGRKLTFMGDARNNVANSLMVVCAKLGIDFCACGPKENMPEEGLVATCEKIAAETGAHLTFTSDVAEGAKDASVIYTDIWVSMGEPDELWGKRIELMRPYQVNEKMFEVAAPDAIFMHCLPSFHDRKTTIGEKIFEKYGLPELEVNKRRLRGPAFARLRRGREPNAYDQGRHVCNAQGPRVILYVSESIDRKRSPCRLQRLRFVLNIYLSFRC